MPISRGIVAMLAALTLCAPAVAGAQTPTTTIPQGDSGVSTSPPVHLGGGSGSKAPSTPPSSAPPSSAPRPAAPSATPTDELPSTGADPGLLALLGVALTMLGVGLRLQTADADLY